MQNSIIYYNQKQANIAKDIFRQHIELCNTNSDITLTPFFIPDINDNDEEKMKQLEKKTDTDYIIKLNQLHEKIGFSRLLYYIYLYIGQDNLEFRLHNYVFFSLTEVERRYNIFCDNDQTKICDLALTYLGMGHVKVLSFDVSSKMIYTRHDGGANGYERDDHWNFCKSLDMTQYKGKLYPLDEFISGEIGDDQLMMVNENMEKY